MSDVFKPTNVDTDPRLNAPKSGKSIIPGTPTAEEYLRWEQFPGKYGMTPGNPWTGPKPYPKMLYRAEEHQGQIRCMATEPNPTEYKDPQEFQRNQALAEQFTKRCQRVVRDEQEEQEAKESGWRDSPKEACDYLEGRRWNRAVAEAHREYEDRNMSPAAKAEVEAEREARGGAHVVEMPEKPRRRGRPKGSKNKKG